MTFPRPDATYWNNKLAAYLHDPIDKVFLIQGHEERAAKQLEVLGLDKPNEAFWKKADGIASGFERGQVPSYSRDPERNGAVNFGEAPVLTHPTARDTRLEVIFPYSESTTRAQAIGERILDFLRDQIGMKPGTGGFSEKDVFKNDHDAFAFGRFLYVHHCLRFKLAENNVAGLGGLWHRMPADSRFPDHTIWQHNALTSALYSSMELAGDDRQVGILAFSITPVQPFIAKARKLRDFWTGSVILSWLAFEGLRWIMEHLGPDHLFYPSLVDQPLINEYLEKSWQIDDVTSFCQERSIASLPNKFLCLIPLNQAEAIAKGITQHIKTAWLALCEKVERKVTGLLGIADPHLSHIFRRQTENYWDLQWTAVKMLEKDDVEEAQSLLSTGSMDKAIEMYEVFAALVRDKWNIKLDARGLLYSNSHSLVQKALAAGKSRKTVNRAPEPGQKCHLCGEFEVLHDHPHEESDSASAYKAGIDEFWSKLAKAWNTEADLDGKEKLCALCLTKRIAYRVFKESRDHVLHACFDEAESFPSTSEVAMHAEFLRKGIIDAKKRREMAQRIHDKENTEEVDHRDRYYAILVMDGDHMGRLINGETMGATWASAMHPQIRDRLRSATFDARYSQVWTPLFESASRRLVTPAIHAAMSEALGDFSIHGVAGIVNDCKGRLIYAGGDDVCAVLPVGTVVRAASEISALYNSAFKFIKGKEIRDVTGNWIPEPGKLAVLLGKNGAEISISAGILVCHHKEHLSQMIARAHGLLDAKAKREAGRNACAVELRKRSGGSRYFVRKWDCTEAWSAFRDIGQLIKGKNKQQVSTSLIYRLELFRDGVDAMLAKENGEELLSQFVVKQLERSGIQPRQGRAKELADRIVEIAVNRDEVNRLVFQPEGLIVAAFIADAESEVN